jgi:hypothetical protein
MSALSCPTHEYPVGLATAHSVQHQFIGCHGCCFLSQTMPCLHGWIVRAMNVDTVIRTSSDRGPQDTPAAVIGADACHSFGSLKLAEMLVFADCDNISYTKQCCQSYTMTTLNQQLDVNTRYHWSGDTVAQRSQKIFLGITFKSLATGIRVSAFIWVNGLNPETYFDWCDVRRRMTRGSAEQIHVQQVLHCLDIGRQYRLWSWNVYNGRYEWLEGTPRLTPRRWKPQAALPWPWRSFCTALLRVNITIKI